MLATCTHATSRLAQAGCPTSYATRKHTASRPPYTRAWQGLLRFFSLSVLACAPLRYTVATGHPRMGAAAWT
eukprot:4969577-Heterocapsa_arctica.AAC.1